MKLTDIILNEGINDNVDRISLIYTNYGDFSKLKIDGKDYYRKQAPEVIKALTGLDLPLEGFPEDSKVQEVLQALKAKGIDAEAYELDVD